MYYPCSENKASASLFSHMQKAGFLITRLVLCLQDQYVFVYDCLLEALISGDTLMTVEEYPEILSEMCQYDNMIQKTKLEEQFDV